MSKINISIDCVVFGLDSDLSLKVLLITKNQAPDAENRNGGVQVALPGDLIKFDEELDPAANRILKSLTSVDHIYLKQFDIFSDPERVKRPEDQLWLRNFRDDPLERVITIGYISLVNIKEHFLKASSFASDVEWVNVSEIPQLTFDHNKIIDSAFEFLRKEMNHELSSILLPKHFTLPQLQSLYENVMDKKFDSRNFRKQMLKEGKMVKTDEISKTGRKGKPATYYKFQEG
jgi:8-oxo-dGTP diphosphatase